MSTAAGDAAKIVNRMREFYRPRSAGELHEPIQVAKLLEDVVHLTEPKWRTQAQAKGCQIKVTTSKDKGAALFYGNPAEIRELLTNLVMNAVDAMPKGGMIELRAESRPGDMIALKVQDTGTGMTEEVRARCLEPFFTTKDHDEGSGLGLAMVYGIVNRHQGTMDIDSKVGIGTSFTIILPVNHPTEVPASPTLEMAPGDRQLDILVVEDDLSVREWLSDHLRDDGHDVVCHSDGSDALREFRDRHFDLVITDRAMPSMSGDELANAIKVLAPRVPIIMVSGFGDMMLGVDERPAGVDMVLGKPVDPGMLRKTIAELTLQVPG
jgi:CheY-like chemotaxis protein